MQDIISQYFEKVRKNLPKKYSGFKDFLNKMHEQLKLDSACLFQRYIIIFKLIINMRVPKLTELSLSTLCRLVSLNLIDGS
jgi:hypothetical protein